MSPNKVEAARTMVWKDVALSGTCAHEFDEHDWEIWMVFWPGTGRHHTVQKQN